MWRRWQASSDHCLRMCLRCLMSTSILVTLALQVEDISGRPKNLWGIWCKLQADGHRDVSRIYDVQALRVVVSNKHECYMALRALESVYRCMPERSKVRAKLGCVVVGSVSNSIRCCGFLVFL